MIKMIILTISMIFLSSCSSTDFFKKDASGKAKNIVIDKTNIAKSDTIADNDATFVSEKLTAATMQNIEAVSKLKASGVVFVLYFAYDEAQIDETLTEQIIKHANFMLDNPALKLRLEGHSDERGTREYNLALGENRALSVREILDLYDLSSRVKVISFGEEKPTRYEHNEAAWQKNRRVEFVYQ